MSIKWEEKFIPSLTGGFNSFLSPELLQENESPDLKNVRFEKGLVKQDHSISVDQTQPQVFRGLIRAIYEAFSEQSTAAGVQKYKILITDSTCYYERATDIWWYCPEVETVSMAAIGAGATAIVANDVTGFAAGDNIGIELDSGELHFTDVVSVVSSTINFTDPIPTGKAADLGNTIQKAVELNGSSNLSVSIDSWEADSVVVFTNGVDPVKRIQLLFSMKVSNIPGLYSIAVSKTTETTAKSTSGTTNIAVTSSSSFSVNNYVAMRMDNGQWHISQITAVPDGTHITINDPIPSGRFVASGIDVFFADVKVSARSLVVFRDTLILLGVTEETPGLLVQYHNVRAWWCAPGDYSLWFSGGANYIDLLESSEFLEAGKNILDRLFLFKNSSINELVFTGKSSGLYENHRIVTGRGTLEPTSLHVIDNVIYSLDDKGLFIFDGTANTQDVGNEIFETLYKQPDLSPKKLKSKVSMAEHRILKQLWIDYLDDSSRRVLLKGPKPWIFREAPSGISFPSVLGWIDGEMRLGEPFLSTYNMQNETEDLDFFIETKDFFFPRYYMKIADISFLAKGSFDVEYSLDSGNSYTIADSIFLDTLKSARIDLNVEFSKIRFKFSGNMLNNDFQLGWINLRFKQERLL